MDSRSGRLLWISFGGIAYPIENKVAPVTLKILDCDFDREDLPMLGPMPTLVGKRTMPRNLRPKRWPILN